MQPSFDLQASLLMIAGFTVLLLPVIQGLVEYAKSLGLQGRGRACLALSMALGIILGGGFYVAAFDIPSEAWQWFVWLLATIVPGLAASGQYDLKNK